MTYTRKQAWQRALASTAYPVGMCMKWTRTQFGIGSTGDFDGDGDADAVDGWKATKHKHPGDRKPPLGVPVFWSGGRNGYGHAAISDGNGNIRGTDSPTSGRIGTVPLSWPERNWGLTYLGWSEDLNGIRIPSDPEPAPKPRRVKRRPAAVRAAIKAAKAARKGAGPVRRARLDKALKWLRRIEKR